MIENNFKIETERLILRQASLQDIPYIFSATQVKDFNEGMLWEPPNQAASLIASYKRSIACWNDGSAYVFSIDQKIKHQFSGRISIRKTKVKDKWNLGFWTHPKNQSKGIMSESVKAILKFGFETLAAQEIEATHAIWNKASEKVLLNNGFKVKKFIPEGFKKRGEWVAENLLSISKQNWILQKTKQ